jgi:hypothetical protein
MNPTPITLRGAQPGRVVKLRVSFGEVPEFGDVLMMASGKRYQVVGVTGKSLRALVLKPSDTIEPGTKVWTWQWDSRKKVAA